ncbi:hypothetical protein [uncultured Massilia sp.]|uniref:hypothetical protein n=1 Tax=uncultured Massilia sp. TaxID=169973 RepID=UPI00258E8256|nr:hypothetical protein [uncultured Massilia sp.]
MQLLLEFVIFFQRQGQGYQILRFLVTAAIRRPKQAAAVSLVLLAALAGAMTYSAFLLVGVLADYLGTGRVVAGLLLGAVLARFPWIGQGRLRLVGLLPKPVRRPLVAGMFALCMVHFLARGDYVSAAFTGFAAGFIVVMPWLRRAAFDRVTSSMSAFGRNPFKRARSDGMVIDGEFRERKD